jgi:hypothetical protein
MWLLCSKGIFNQKQHEERTGPDKLAAFKNGEDAIRIQPSQRLLQKRRHE